MTKIFLPIFVEPWFSFVHLAFCLFTVMILHAFPKKSLSSNIYSRGFEYRRWKNATAKFPANFQWSLFITIRWLTDWLKGLEKKKKRERPVSRGRMVSRHAKTFTPACTKRHQVHGVAGGTFATHAESAWTDFFSLYRGGTTQVYHCY